MDHKQAKPIQPKKNHPTVLGSVLLLIFDLVLLVLLSWFVLTAWFCIKAVFSSVDSVNAVLQNIIYQYLGILSCHYPKNIQAVLGFFDVIKQVAHSGHGIYVQWNIIEFLFSIVLVIVLRCCIFIAFLPLMFLILFVFIVDGLVERDKRKFQGARESTFVFHRTMPLGKSFFLLLFFIYMVLPWFISPETILVPMDLFIGLLTTLAIKHFKKYL